MSENETPELITVTARVVRRTEYLITTKMTQAKFDNLREGLESFNKQTKRAARDEINRLVKSGDWADDELLEVEDFEKASD